MKFSGSSNGRTTAFDAVNAGSIPAPESTSVHRRIRAGSGLGDALYLRPIVQHLSRTEPIEVCTHFPELFRFPGVRCAPFSRENIHYTAHYMNSKRNRSTHQFQDMCVSVGISRRIDLALDWKVCDPALVDRIQRRAAGRPVLLVHGGREAFGRSDGYGIEMLPLASVFQSTLAMLRTNFFTVYVGQGRRLYPLAVDLDLNDRTIVTDIVDIATIASACFAQCSFMIPLAESLAKPLLVLFAEKGFASKKEAVRTITPEKTLSKSSSSYIVDNWDAALLNKAIMEFCHTCRSGGSLSRKNSDSGRECADVSA